MHVWALTYFDWLLHFVDTIWDKIWLFLFIVYLFISIVWFHNNSWYFTKNENARTWHLLRDSGCVWTQQVEPLYKPLPLQTLEARTLVIEKARNHVFLDFKISGFFFFSFHLCHSVTVRWSRPVVTYIILWWNMVDDNMRIYVLTNSWDGTTGSPSKFDSK